MVNIAIPNKILNLLKQFQRKTKVDKVEIQNKVIQLDKFVLNIHIKQDWIKGRVPLLDHNLILQNDSIILYQINNNNNILYELCYELQLSQLSYSLCASDSEKIILELFNSNLTTLLNSFAAFFSDKGQVDLFFLFTKNLFIFVCYKLLTLSSFGLLLSATTGFCTNFTFKFFFPLVSV